MADSWNANAPNGTPQPENPAAQTEANGHAQNGTNGTSEQRIPGWVEPKPYDYAAMEGAGETQTWDGSAPIYQWDDEYGDVGPALPELERHLFGDPEKRGERTGLDFEVIDKIDVLQEGPVQIAPIKRFEDAGLHPAMLENVKLEGYRNPTPIQRYTVPAILQGHDVIGIAQTGSGKTAAYLVPILSKLMGKAKKLAAWRPNPATFRQGIDGVTAEPLVVIIVPTRELATQIFNEARKFCYRTMLRPAVVYGGPPVAVQRELLSKGCDVLVATPGRLKHFIDMPDILTLRRVRYMVIDEADQMLDMKFEEDIRIILSGSEQDDGNVKYCLFSATFPKAARDLAKEYLADSHVRFRVGRAGSTTANIQQKIIQAERHEKRDVLLAILQDLSSVRTIIFVNSRVEADNLDDFLFNMKLPVTSIHSERTQTEREIALNAFRAAKAPILVATGVAARGIDIKDVMHVINYDLPSIDYGGIEEYTHRIGRTGRMGWRGSATSLFSERDEPMASVLTRTLLETGQDIPDFLEPYAPQGEARTKLVFETESDFDPNDLGSAADFGSAPFGDGEAAAAGEGAWNADSNAAPAADTNGWGPGPDQPAPDQPAATNGSGWGAAPQVAAAW